MELVADLMETTGKPIINVPDLPIQKSVFDVGRRYHPIVLTTPQAAVRALDRMEWYGAYRRAGSVTPRPRGDNCPQSGLATSKTEPKMRTDGRDLSSGKR
jgi:hypothetical protein